MCWRECLEDTTRPDGRYLVLLAFLFCSFLFCSYLFCSFLVSSVQPWVAGLAGAVGGTFVSVLISSVHPWVAGPAGEVGGHSRYRFCLVHPWVVGPAGEVGGHNRYVVLAPRCHLHSVWNPLSDCRVRQF
jgi:hypothetical protein